MTERYEYVLSSRVEGTGDILRQAEALDTRSKAEQKLARAQRRSVEVQEKLNAARAAGDSTSTNFVVVRNGSGGGSAGGSGSTAGPYQRLEYLKKQIDEAKASGSGPDSSKMRDLLQARARAEKAIERIEHPPLPPSRTDKIGQAFLSTRFGQNGVEPLIGRAAAALGINTTALAGMVGKLAGPIGLAITAVMAVKGAFDLAADSAQRITTKFTDVRSSTGASTLGAAQLGMIAGFTGVDAPGAARAFHQRIATDPVAMGFAAMAGVRAGAPGPFGPTDQSASYRQAIERVSGISNGDDRIRTARALGIEQEVGRYSLLSPEMRSRMERTSQVSAQINDSGAQQRGAEMVAAMERAGQSTQNVKDAFGNLMGGRFIDFLNAYSDIADQTALQVNSLSGLVYGSAKKPGSSYGSGGSDGALESRQIAATSDLTRAMIALTSATERSTRGGGARTSDAIPKNLSGQSFIAAANLGALRRSSI